MDFLIWHYTFGINYYIDSWSNTIAWFSHYFSPILLLKTLFAPWKRLSVKDTTQGFNFQKWFEEVTFNMVSRWVGASVRLILFGVGIVLIIVSFLGGAVGLIFWLMLPFFSLPVYSKYRKQLPRFMFDLKFKIKQSKDTALSVIFNSSAGNFVLTHVGVDMNDFINNAQKKALDYAKEFKTFSDLIVFLIDNKLWTEQYFNQKGISVNDLILASNWWDKKQIEETSLEKENFGRSGIALDLTFGYTPTLNKYSVDLSAPQSFTHHLIGRQQIVNRMERVLSSGSNVLLIGQPGVGKKTVVLEFAHRAVTGQLGKAMSFKRVLEFDYNALLSESSDLNLKKTRFAEILIEAKEAGNIILMIRDIQRLTNSEVEGYDFTDTLEQYLEERKLKIIAVSTNIDYERFISQNLRLRKYFERVEVVPPTKEEAMEILVEGAVRWEKISGITITVPSLRHILEQSDRYITETPFPEKAIELLDAVISYKQQQGDNTLISDDVNSVLAEKTGISFARLTSEEKNKLANIEGIIHKRLIDQDTAVNLIGKTLRSKLAGVVKENKPIGSFLFLGPTGVGKTETAKVLSKVYYGSEDHILRFDMAEYSGKEGLERLIGSVAKSLPGALTTEIKNKPASLLLLDEIEKATKEIYNLFLALLDEGLITDAFGKKIICRHLFVIATSNAGAEYIRNLVNKGVYGEELQKSVVNFVLEKEIFSPEFLNRFDGVIVYEPLKKEDLVKIAEILLQELADNLKKKNIFLEVTNDLVKKLSEDGFDPAFGARPMKRIINIILGDIIGKAILKGEIGSGDKIRINAGSKKEEFSLDKLGK